MPQRPEGDYAELTKDLIVDIPQEREKFFGCSGKMLLPCPATVASLIDEVPAGRLITTNLLRAELARRKGVQATCPPSAQRALKAAIAEGTNAPWWRVIKENGELFASFPGGIEAHAAHLAADAVEIDCGGGKPKVAGHLRRLIRFPESE